MRTGFIIFCIFIWMASCSKYEVRDIPNVYEYDPDQPVVIDVEVIPMNDVVLEFDDMDLEVNADYYNRYGIGINLYEGDRQYLDDSYRNDGRIFLPQHTDKEPKEHITIYVLPREYVQFAAFGYAIRGHGNAIVREDAQSSRTLAHEIGHLLDLGHVDMHIPMFKNNVMTPMGGARQYNMPNDFHERQIDTMLITLDTKGLIFNNLSMKGGKGYELIID